MSQSTVAKIENGVNAITLENLLKISVFYWLDFTEVAGAVHRYAMWLHYFHGYEVVIERIPQSEDSFIRYAIEYYKSDRCFEGQDKGFPAMSGGEVLNFPSRISRYSVNNIKESDDYLFIDDVFRYATNETFRTGEIIKTGRWNRGVKHTHIDDPAAVIDFLTGVDSERNGRRFSEYLMNNPPI